MATTYAIKWLKDKLGVKFFPVTHIKAVRDDNNIDLDVLLGRKQDTLISGTNIKTINDLSILGSGNIEVPVPTKTSDLINDSEFITSADIPEGSAASTTTPKMDGTASVGTEMAFARGDHRHPSDSSKANVSDFLAVESADEVVLNLPNNLSLNLITAHQDISDKADKSATVSTVTYNTTSKKITKTINGTITDVVTAAKIVTDGGGITSHQDISGKADKATTLAGYGITDAKIASGTITLGSNTITPLTASSTLDATKLSGTIPTDCYSNTDTKVTLTATTTNSAYEILFSGTADNTSRTEGVRKTSTLTYNPSTKALVTGGTVNGYTLAAASAKGVDTSIAASSSSTNLPTSAAVASFVEGKGYLTSHLSLANYVTLNTEQTISALKTFTAGITTGWMNMKHSTDTSQARGISWLNTSGTTIARILYHNTAQNILIDPTGATDPWTDAVGKYSLFVGNNKLTYNTYPILTSNNVGTYAVTIGTDQTITGIKTFNNVIKLNGYGIEDTSGAGMLVYHPVGAWSGVDSTQWGVGAASSQGVIRSSNADLIHYKGGTNTTIIDSSNYTSYTVTKTGSGASGTWGINVSGTATGLAYKTLNGDAVDSTAGTFAFGGNNYSTWSGADYAGLQVSGLNDKFQIAANNGHLVFRQNDSGGTNTSWNAWATVIDTTNAGTLFTDLSKDSNRKLSITIGGTTKTLEYYPNSIQAYTHNRIEGTTSPFFKWYKIFTVTINGRFAYGSANFMITDLGRSTSGDSRQSHIVCHYQQQNAFGSKPFVNLYILDGNCGTQYLKGVYTLNSDSTTIDIYTCASYSYMRPAITNICTYVSNGTWNYPIGGVVDAPTFNIDSEYQTQMQAQNFNSTVYSKFMYFRNNANDGNAGYVGAGSTANDHIALVAYSGNNLLLGGNGTTQATFDGSKLELKGTTNTPLKLKGNNSDSTWISFFNSSDTLIGYLGADSANNGLRYSNGTSYWNVLHTGNYSTYLDDIYVNKTGDTMTNTLNVSGNNHGFKIIGSSYTFGLHLESGGTNRGIYQQAPTDKWLLYFDANNTILNQGNLDLTAGSIITTHGSSNHVNGSKNAVINCNYTSYGAIFNAPVKSGRISMNTCPQSDDYVRLSYFTSSNVTNNVNTQTHQLRWLATTGQLLLDGHLLLEGAQTSSSTSNTTQIIFRSNSTEQIAISSNTNALIINPTSSATTGQIVLGVNGNNTWFTSSGKFGIGVNNPSQKLHVSGNILATGEITAYSDIRLKKNIKPLQVRGELKPVTYEKDGKKSIGFIAQDVLEIYPELVTELGEDKILSLNYAQLTAVLQAEILELKEEIKKLKNNK